MKTRKLGTQILIGEALVLLESQEPEPKSSESEAFAATVDNYGLRLYEIARLSGLTPEKVEKFYKGKTNLTTRSLTKIICALTPTQSAFYSALVQAQESARSAKIQLPLIKFRDIVDITDVYRQAFIYTLTAFDIELRSFGLKADIIETNIQAWKSGRRDFTQESMDKLKSGLTIEQRTVFLALVEIFLIAATEKMQKILPKSA